MSDSKEPFGLLRTIAAPADLRALPEKRLKELAEELRQFLIQTVSTRGGHFAAGLGTIELTIALHYVFVKQHGGLAPFPHRGESEYDTFGVGHSSTSISAALGMALAAAAKGESRRVVAVIGDGALSAGMAFEALNHAGSLPTDLLVILNDNDMSISENVGAMSKYLARVLSGRFYAHLRESGKRVLRRMPHLREFARRSEKH